MFGAASRTDHRSPPCQIAGGEPGIGMRRGVIADVRSVAAAPSTYIISVFPEVGVSLLLQAGMRTMKQGSHCPMPIASCADLRLS